MHKKIYLSPPHLTKDAMRYLHDAVQSNWIAPVGPDVEGFETELGALLKTGKVLSANSGTSAIHLGLLAMGVGRDDEVICSTFTFCASAAPIIYCGAKPVFIDSESETWNMDPDLLDEAVNDRIKKGRKPKAIIVVHMYGMPAMIDKIMAVANYYEIPVLEDAAEALGSLYYGKAVGTFGEAGIVSFNGNKIITTSGGGALLSNNLQLVERASYFRQEAKEPLPYYEHKAIGYNYRLSNLLAALGRSQLYVLEERVKAKRSIFNFYFDQLSNIPGISFQPEAANVRSNRWLTTILIRQRGAITEPLRMMLAENQVESRHLWKPLHLQPVFREFPAFINGVSEEFFECGLCLPSGTNLQVEDLNRVCSLLKTQLS